MSELNFLLSNYSIGEIFLIIVVALIVVKLLMELGKYFYDKARTYFGMKNKRETWEESTSDSLGTITNKIDNLEEAANQRKERLIAVETKIDTLEEYSEETHKNQKELRRQMETVQERLQENTRSFLIDAHHRFKYEIGGIDDLNLQSMERRYLFYKTAGGDSFIDDLMEEVRKLPRLNYINTPILPNDGREIHG